MKKLVNEFNELTKVINIKTLIVTIVLLFLGLFSQFYDLGPQENFYRLLIDCFSNYFFFITIILAISINIVSISNTYKTSNYILRNKNYKEYLKNILRKNLIYITFIIIITLILSIFMSLIGTDFKIINEITIYNMPIIFFTLYHIIRFITIIYLLSLIIFYIEKRFGNNFVFIVIFILFVSIFIPLNIGVVIDITNMYPFIINYILGYEFSTFNLDLVCSIIQVLKLIILIIILKYLCISKRKDNL